MTDLDREYRSPLHHAAFEGDRSKAAPLLEQGANPNQADRMGFTPLHFAAQKGSVEVAELLLDAEAEIDSANSYGNTPLWTAVFNCEGSGDMIRLLRSAGRGRGSLLHRILRSTSKSRCEGRLPRGPAIPTRDSSDSTPHDGQHAPPSRPVRRSERSRADPNHDCAAGHCDGVRQAQEGS